ncbi:MAG: LysM domain-containing protein [Chloroflexi bacterium]|nr:LysM domain-containing protein [Chloroflexota bacterium]
MTATPRATLAPTRASGATVTPVSLASASGQSTHTVAAGDSLWQIATRYNTTVDAIVRANRLADPNILAPGDRLVIPR